MTSFLGLLFLRHLFLGLFWLDLYVGHHLLLIAARHLLLLWLDVDGVVFLPVEASSVHRLGRLQSLLLDEFLQKGTVKT